MADVSVRGLTKRYGGFVALPDIDLEIANGEFIVFVGPSGSGKSTLLRCIAGLEPIAGGRVSIGGRDVTQLDPADRDLSMVFQNYALFPHLSCRANLEFPLKTAGTLANGGHEKVARVGEMLHIGALLDRKPAELSGGQRQRVAIGRAIVKEPKVFLFDEPLSNLDAELRIRMRIEIVKLHRALKNTIIYVTHDQVEAMTMADRIVVLRNGVIEQVGSPYELYHFPANRFVAGFIGAPQMNVLPCQVTAVGARSTTVSLGGQGVEIQAGPGGSAEGMRLSLGFRPEHVAFAPPEAPALRLSLAVDVVEHLGALTNLHGSVSCGSETPGEVTAATAQSVTARFGDTVEAWVPADACHLFDAEDKSLPRHVTPPPWT